MKIFPKKLTGTVHIQPSKSYLHRMLIMAALSGGTVEVCSVNYSDDVKATVSALETMGLARCECRENSVLVSRGSGKVSGVVDCGESGSTLRFLIAVALTLDKEVTFTGHGRLMERPQNVYEELCREKGFTFVQEGDKLTVRGRLEAGVYRMAGNVSSQFISGMMMALAVSEGSSEINMEGQAESVGYIDVTADVLTCFGVRAVREGGRVSISGRVNPPARVTAQGDWSHGSNFACIGARCGGLTVTGLDMASLQKDRAVIDILKGMGASISEREGSLVFAPSELTGTDLTGRDIPDIIPVLCVLLGVCKGSHRVMEIGRLRLKESDRIEATCALINGIGGRAVTDKDDIIIEGVPAYTGGAVSTFGDHRIAMAAAVASCYSTGVIEIDDGECVKKSAPAFWKEFKDLGGQIEDV